MSKTPLADLLGRQPTDADRLRLMKIRDALGIADNDALWLLLVTLHGYQTEYDRVPGKIAAASKSVLSDFQRTADAAAKASFEKTKAGLSAEVAKTARTVAKQSAQGDRAKWFGGAALAAAIALCGVGGWAFNRGDATGYARGYQAGYEKAHVENSEAAWGNSNEGQIAHALARATSIIKLARCEEPGWVVRGDQCFPYSTTIGGKSGTYGWHVPQ